MKSLKDIQKLARKFNVKPRPEMRSKILEEALEIQRNRKQQSTSGTYIWRSIMKSKITKFAAAAVIIIAVLIGINQFGGSIDGASVAWAEVAEKVEKIRTFVCQRKDLQKTADKDQIVETKLVMYNSTEYGSRIDSYKGEDIQVITYTLPAEKAIITVIPSAQKHIQRPLTEEMLKEMEQKSPREMVRRFFSLEYKELGRKIINGVVVEGIEVNDPRVLSANFPIEKIIARLWVDIETNLPVLVETEVIGQEEKFQFKTIIDEFQWNIALDAEMFKPDIGIDESSSVAELLNGPRMHLFADGSQVDLAEDAKIRLYDRTNRRGFEHIAGEIEVVVKKGVKEFVITSVFGTVKALGTVFKMDIVRVDSTNLLAVKVEEGVVEVSNAKGSKLIRANQRLTVEENKPPYDFQQDENLPPRLVERIQAMLDAMEKGDKSAWLANFNTNAFYDLAKGKIEYEQHPDWFSGMSPDDANRFKQGLANVNSPEELKEIMIADISDNIYKLYVRSVTLDEDGKHAMAVCVKKQGQAVGFTPQWTFFDGDWWQTDD